MILSIFVLFQFYCVIIHHSARQNVGYCLQIFKQFLGYTPDPHGRRGDQPVHVSINVISAPLFKLWRCL